MLENSFLASMRSHRHAPPRGTFKAIAIDEEQGVLIAVASTAGNVDTDGDVISVPALRDLAYDFTAGDRKFKSNHKQDINCELVGSWVGAPILKSGRVLKAGDEPTSDDPIVAISLEKGTECAWIVALRPDPSVIKAAKNGKVMGLSWGGVATTEE